MKHLLRTILPLLTAFTVLTPENSHAQETVRGGVSGSLRHENTLAVAVFNLRNNSDIPGTGERISEIIRVLIPDFRPYIVIDNSVLSRWAQKNNQEFSNITGINDAMRIVSAHDVPLILTGDICKLGGKYSINLKLADSKTGTLLQASGMEIDDILNIRTVVRGLLERILEKRNVSGKPVLTEYQLQQLEKKNFISLGIGVATTIVNAAAFGGTAMLSEKQNPYHIFTSASLLLPPLAPLYTEDWEITPLTLGFSAASGICNFIGYAFIDNGSTAAARGFGRVLRYEAGLTKILSMSIDIIRVPHSVRKYNSKLKTRYYITRKEKPRLEILPLIYPRGAGAVLSCRL